MATRIKVAVLDTSGLTEEQTAFVNGMLEIRHWVLSSYEAKTRRKYAEDFSSAPSVEGIMQDELTIRLDELKEWIDEAITEYIGSCETLNSSEPEQKEE